jgi:hypothetical protein
MQSLALILKMIQQRGMHKIFLEEQSLAKGMAVCSVMMSSLTSSPSCFARTFLGKSIFFAVRLMNYNLSREQSQHCSSNLIGHRLKIND